MLVCKLDTSTTDDEKAVVCMAGYLALLPAWAAFEIAARRVLDEYKVTLLHAKEFYDTKGDFAGWPRDKKEGFVRKLQHNCILGRLDLGVVFAAPKAAWTEAKREHGGAHSESVFGFCFRAILDQILQDEIVGKVIADGETLSFVLESGDENAGDALRIWREAKARHNHLLYSFGFAAKDSAIGLQIADFLAVTSRKYISRHNAVGSYPEEPAIASILREGIYLIDIAAERFVPDPRWVKKKNG